MPIQSSLLLKHFGPLLLNLFDTLPHPQELDHLLGVDPGSNVLANGHTLLDALQFLFHFSLDIAQLFLFLLYL